MEQSLVTSEGSQAGAEVPAKTSSDNTVPLPVAYQGTLDLCTSTRLGGWGVKHGLPAELDVVVNDRTDRQDPLPLAPT